MEMYTYKEVADKLRVSERTVWDLVKKRQLKACKIAGRTIRISEEALRNFIKQAELV